MERLKRADIQPDLSNVPPMQAVDFNRNDDPKSIVNAMAEYQAMMDAIRDGLVNRTKSECPDDPTERAQHLKGFGYFSDASMIGICRIPDGALLDTPIINPDIDRLAEDLRTKQTKTLTAGIDVIMADLKESMEAPLGSVDGHTHAIVFLYEQFRDPKEDEPGAEWILDAQAHRACLRATETACVLGNYLRVLGYESRSHSGAASDVDLNKLANRRGSCDAGGRQADQSLSGRSFWPCCHNDNIRTNARRTTCLIC